MLIPQIVNNIDCYDITVVNMHIYLSILKRRQNLPTKSAAVIAKQQTSESDKAIFK